MRQRLGERDWKQRRTRGPVHSSLPSRGNPQKKALDRDFFLASENGKHCTPLCVTGAPAGPLFHGAGWGPAQPFASRPKAGQEIRKWYAFAHHDNCARAIADPALLASGDLYSRRLLFEGLQTAAGWAAEQQECQNVGVWCVNRTRGRTKSRFEKGTTDHSPG